ncbi:hypothetical protein Pka01_77720 [Planotetraspora kaengkrachanensis]|uniref:Uncharacterized protein n=1 Tax=Planotetraspora kaengkrachanensis TaxID=575193 RepID=A0A8J3Q0U8_9ACTN|nr:hypothetical protein Pka01_77720 [Planotetraspora kaengkrachanensis]
MEPVPPAGEGVLGFSGAENPEGEEGAEGPLAAKVLVATRPRRATDPVAARASFAALLMRGVFVMSQESARAR